MAEEFRYFLRTALYVVAAGVVYWLVSYEPSGTVLLGALLLAILAFIAIAMFFARSPVVRTGSRGALGWLDRVIGFDEPVDRPPPMEGGPEIVPLGSAWPVVTALALVIIGLGLIFGAWLIVPGLALLLIGGWGWLTQLDDVEMHEANGHHR